MYVHKPMVTLSRSPRIFLCVQIIQNIDGFRQNNAQGFKNS